MFLQFATCVVSKYYITYENKCPFTFYIYCTIFAWWWHIRLKHVANCKNRYCFYIKKHIFVNWIILWNIKFSASDHFVALHLELVSSPQSLRIRLHTIFFSLLDSRSSNLRLFSIFVCFIINTSTQPSPKWQYGDIPFGLREHAQDTLAPLTIKNFPWNVFHSVKKRPFLS